MKNHTQAQGRQPLAVFGNNSGDYDSDLYEEMELGVSSAQYSGQVPGHRPGGGGNFCSEAAQVYAAGYHENTGTFDRARRPFLWGK